MVRYEWDVERVQDISTAEVEAGEVIHHDFADSYADALRRAAKPAFGQRNDIVLVRDDDKGRCWAYMFDGALPAEFTEPDETGAYLPNGVKVPQRFRAEIARATTVSA